MSASANSSFYVTIATQKGSTTKKVVGEVLSVGRAEDCNLSIAHETMSRRHLSVVVRNGECWVEDHGSANGTFVNGSRVKAHDPVRLSPEDQVELAQSGIKLLVSTEPTTSEKTIVARTAQPPVPAPTVARSQVESQQRAETLVLEAYKKSSQLVHEAEIEAERRVEDIYRRAEEVQARTDAVYQQRLNEAYRSAEEAFQKAQSEAMEILAAARHRSVEMRDLAEKYVTDMRIRAEKECERILYEAQATARDLKVNRLMEADEVARLREKELLDKANEEINARLAKFEEELFQQGVRRRAEIENELAAKGEAIRQLSAALEQTQEEIRLKTVAVQALRGDVAGLEALRAEKMELEKGRQMAGRELKTLQDQLTEFRTRVEEEKVRLMLEEQQRMEELKAETVQKVRLLEKEMIAELQVKKDRMGRELTHLMETELKGTPEGHDLDLAKLEGAVIHLLNGQLAALSKDKVFAHRQRSLASLRRRDKIWSHLSGLMVGIGSVLAIQYGMAREWGVSPVQQKVVSAMEQQKQDLEKRRFNPLQTREYRPNYVDNVIYHENFVATYLSDDFQDALLGEASPYLLRVWRIDEDKTIQLMAMASALVKTLADRREVIHPDFVKSSVDKMRVLEADGRAKMAALLGSEVRLESFRKFESEFYARYVARAPKSGR